jgi:hypothetical protein
MRKYFIIKGGLGNQLFQLGGSLNICEDMRDIYLVDACNYFDQNREFLCNQIFTDFNIKVIKYNYFWMVFMFIIRRFSILRRIFKIYIEEKNDNMGLLNSFRIYEGYFQCQGSVRSLLLALEKKDLTLRGGVFDEERLGGDGRVMVHVRRGDYRLYKNTYEILDLSYYKRALMHASKSINIKNVYVYSSEEVVDVIKTFEKYPVQFRSRKFTNDVNEFMEMVRSNIFIIANSSFSFWAAILSDNTSKMIIMPKSYLADFELTFVIRI